MKLFISSHADDAALFGAYTLMREKPLVLTITDSFIQSNRGDNITADMRWAEDIEAMKILGCSLILGGIRDDIIDEWGVKNLLSKFYNFDTVYAPAVQGGNEQHDLIGRLAKERFPNAIQYSTYAKDEWITRGKTDLHHTPDEYQLKMKALDCYKSQISLSSTAPHFEAQRKDGSEWYI
jgi:LmbE family N-acetylglucosaminyl deacetylase